MEWLSAIDEVRALKNNLRGCFETGGGLELMKFMESLCGWYDFNEVDPNMILIKHGKRQVLATIKTILNSTPEQIVAMANQRSQNNE